MTMNPIYDSPAVRTTGLSKNFADVWAVSNLDLEVARVVHADHEAAGELADVGAVPMQDGSAVLGGAFLAGEMPACGKHFKGSNALQDVQLRTHQNLLVASQASDEPARGAVKRQLALRAHQGHE